MLKQRAGFISFVYQVKIRNNMLWFFGVTVIRQ